MASSPRPKVVVVGAGFGGLTAAKHLARADVDLTVVDKRNHHLFQPLLYQVATAVLSPAEIAVPIRSILPSGRDRPISVLMDEVEGIDRAARQVRTHGGAEIPYDYLIVATGSQYNYFGNEAEWTPHAPALKSLDDALNIRRRVLLAFERAETTTDAKLRERLMTFVVVGGGPTGVETAGALAELAKATLAKDFHNIDPTRAKVYLVEATDNLLGGFPGHLGGYTAEKLKHMGVEVLTDAPVKAVTSDGVELDDRTLSSANVIWCAGVKGTAAAQWLEVPAEKNGTISVGRDLKLPDDDRVYVVGDVSSVRDEAGDPLPALAPVAKQQGKYAAESIIRDIAGEAPQEPFRYRDWGTMATIGRAAAVGKFGRFEVRGFPAWLLWGAVHITYLVGFRNRVAVTINWLWAWLTYAKGSRLITGPDEAAVRALDSSHAVEAELEKTVTNLEKTEPVA